MALTALGVNLQLCTAHFTDPRGDCALSPLPVHISEPLENSHVYPLLVPSGTIGKHHGFFPKLLQLLPKAEYPPPWKKFPTIRRMYKRK